MLPDSATVLLAGSDPDLLLLRSAVLAAAGIWSLRVRTLDQAIQVIGLVPFDLAIVCYSWEAADREQLVQVLANHHISVQAICLAPGDDCSGTNLLRKVKDALATPALELAVIAESAIDSARMIR